MTRHERINDFRAKHGVKFIIAYAALITVGFPLLQLYQAHETQSVVNTESALTHNTNAILQKHSQTLSAVESLSQQNRTILQKLATGHTDTQKALAGIQSLLGFVAAYERSSTKPNPDVVKIDQDLNVICARLGDPGCK